MPIPRKKSCCHCRAAKARCSLGVPCERCSERNLHCDYGIARSGTEPYRISSRAAAARQPLENDGPLANTGRGGLAGGQSLAIGSQANGEAPALQSPSTSTPFGLSEATVNVMDTNFDFFSGIFAQGRQPSGSLFFGQSDENDLQGSSYAGGEDLFSPTLDRSLSTMVECRARHRLLSQRKTPTTEMFFTAKVLVGQIRQYPKMMIEGKKLPPFIHPRCASGNWLPDSCATGEKHVCMPESLAICANLIHLFYNRTPASSRFVWETIHTHQNQLYQEHLRYSSDKLLEALQTTVIYLLLQAEDPESVEINNTLSLLETICDIARRCYTLSNYATELNNPFSVERKTWTEIESARRTVCLLWIIELVLDVMIGPPRETEMCGGYSKVPLPCDRRLWEPVSDAEWTRRYRQSLGGKKTSMLKVQDLRFPRQSVSSTVGDHNEALAEWCEGMDDFGALVWMAGMLERSNG